MHFLISVSQPFTIGMLILSDLFFFSPVFAHRCSHRIHGQYLPHTGVTLWTKHIRRSKFAACLMFSSASFSSPFARGYYTPLRVTSLWKPWEVSGKQKELEMTFKVWSKRFSPVIMQRKKKKKKNIFFLLPTHENFFFPTCLTDEKHDKVHFFFFFSPVCHKHRRDQLEKKDCQFLFFFSSTRETPTCLSH